MSTDETTPDEQKRRNDARREADKKAEKDRNDSRDQVVRLAQISTQALGGM